MQDFFTTSVAVTWCDCLNVPLAFFFVLNIRELCFCFRNFFKSSMLISQGGMAANLFVLLSSPLH